MSIPKSLSRLMELLSKLPGIGPKSAERIAFYILRSQGDYAGSLTSAISEAKSTIKPCRTCRNISERDICEICSSPDRDGSLLCVVEHPNDIIAIEKMGRFSGRYFCLMGALSPLDGIGPDDLKVNDLINLIKEKKIREIIIATDSDQEGDTTALYLSRVIKTLGVRLTRIAFGIPVGSNIEYADQATLVKAFEGRRQFS